MDTFTFRATNKLLRNNDLKSTIYANRSIELGQIKPYHPRKFFSKPSYKPTQA